MIYVGLEQSVFTQIYSVFAQSRQNSIIAAPDMPVRALTRECGLKVES